MHPISEIGGGCRGRHIEGGAIKDEHDQLGVIPAEHEELSAGVTDDHLPKDSSCLAEAFAHFPCEFGDPSGLVWVQREIVDEDPASLLQEDPANPFNSTKFFRRGFKIGFVDGGHSRVGFSRH